MSDIIEQGWDMDGEFEWGKDDNLRAIALVKGRSGQQGNRGGGGVGGEGGPDSVREPYNIVSVRLISSKWPFQVLLESVTLPPPLKTTYFTSVSSGSTTNACES